MESNAIQKQVTESGSDVTVQLLTSNWQILFMVDKLKDNRFNAITLTRKMFCHHKSDNEL